jgi:Uma2 family endonuclease
MTLVQQQPSTKYSAEELLRAQSEGGVEFVNGRIVEKPVSIGASRVESKVVRLLGNEAAKGGSVEVFPSGMGYQCFPDEPNRYRKPDVSAVRSERLAGFDPDTGLIPFPPDLAVEVVSPNDVVYDLNEKIEDYLKNGFRLIWVIDPNARTVTIYRGDRSVSLLHDQDELAGEAALPSFRCKVSEFFTP